MINMKIFNTLTRKKEDFKPIKEGHINMYVCGPTVYGPIHIGNARTFLTFDIVYRYFKLYKEWKVNYVQNITDVGHLTDVGQDKMIVGAKKMDMNVKDFAELMTKNYFNDLKTINILPPNKSPKASEHIQDMIEVIKKLIEKGYAYETSGFVYYDITKFSNYGKLGKKDPKELEKQRQETHGNKKHEGDFVLWFPAPEDYPMKWNSPWGAGFPGWHIECSTMSSKYLGLPFDIHGGGEDLAFPHHEDEIAQAEGASGKKFVNYWMHSGYLNIKGAKMSKSIGNILTLRDAVKNYGGKTIRYFLISSHYRKSIDLTEEGIKSASNTVKNLINFIDRIKEIETKGEYNQELKNKIKESIEKFEHNMDDDFNMPPALASVFELISETNKAIDEKKINKENLDEVYEAMMNFDKVLGILEHKKTEIPKEIEDLANKRENARKKKDFKESDKIREEIKKLGYVIEDSAEGPRIKKI